MTPELPRAPISEPRLTAWQTSSIDSAVRSSVLTDSSVSDMFVPVSPSGTGYTFRRLSSSWCARNASRKRRTACRRSAAPKRVSVGIGAQRTGVLASPCSIDGSRISTEKGVRTMSSVCDVCAKKPVFGMSISHSHRRTKRRWNPNIQRVRAIVDGSPKRVNVCTSCLKAGKVVKA